MMKMKYSLLLCIALLISGCNCKNFNDFISSSCYYDEPEECVDCEQFNTPVIKEET